MWGNALGWSISLLMVIAAVAGVRWLDRSARILSAPTTFSQNSEHTAAISLPVSPKKVLPTTNPSDAAPIYRAAIAMYEQEPETYERFARDGRLREVDTVPAIDILTQATEYESADFFTQNPREIVNYQNEKPALDALQTLGACARRAGQLIQSQQPGRALKLYEATFSLGEKLYNERLIYAELDDGLTMMAESATLIGILDPTRANTAEGFNNARKNYVEQQLLPVLRIIGSADQTILETHAGDVFYFAEHAGDRMWRVEAILKLGRYRFNAGRFGDQRAAMTLLKKISGDPDPVIRAAANAAINLTEQQYRMLH
jgi:hypothetical protein